MTARLIKTVCACCLVSPTVGQEADSPWASDLSVCHVVFLDNETPFVIRLHLFVDGQPLGDRWRTHVRSVFSNADQNGDDHVSGTERVIKADGIIAAQLGSAVTHDADDNPVDGKVSLSEFTDWLAYGDYGPCPPRVPMTDGYRNLWPGLFRDLDTDRNGKLTTAELSVPPRQRDLNDDGIFSSTELTNPSVRGRRRQPVSAPQSGVFFALSPRHSSTQFVRALINKYTKDGSGVPVSVFRSPQLLAKRFDFDGDGVFDFTELRQLFMRPPADVVLRVRLKPDDASGSLELVGTVRGTKRFLMAGDTLSLQLGEAQLEIVSVDEGRAGTAFLRNQLRRADVDRNGYVDRDEAGASVFRAAFGQFDNDRDGKVFEKELLETIEARREFASCQVRLTARNQGKSLFRALDDNQDAQLSFVEFTPVAGRIAFWDRDDDDAVSADEIPQVFRLVVSRGRPHFPGVDYSLLQSPTGRARNLGPGWFVKMDRNQDGEVDRREFPGSPRAFADLDRDGNQRVTWKEARAAGERNKTTTGSPKSRKGSK